MANLLDNAIEAAVQNHVNNRDIKTVGIIKGGRFFLQVQNPYEREPVMSGGEIETTKESKEGHGLGLKSVRRIVEKYGMEMEIVMEGGILPMIAIESLIAVIGLVITAFGLGYTIGSNSHKK